LQISSRLFYKKKVGDLLFSILPSTAAVPPFVFVNKQTRINPSRRGGISLTVLEFLRPTPNLHFIGRAIGIKCILSISIFVLRRVQRTHTCTRERTLDRRLRCISLRCAAAGEMSLKSATHSKRVFIAPCPGPRHSYSSNGE